MKDTIGVDERDILRETAVLGLDHDLAPGRTGETQIIRKTSSSQRQGRTLTNENKAPRIITIKNLGRTADSLIIEGQINGTRIKITVDTGAEVSLLSSKDAKAMELEPLSILRTVTGEKAPVAETSAEESLQIQPDVATISKEVGGNLALTCRPNVPDTSLVNQLEWQDPKGRRIDNTRRTEPMYYQDLYGEKGKMLIFTHLTEQQAGKYRCTAIYSTKPLSAEIDVKTYTAISFEDAPENQYPVVGQDYVVRCRVSANPTPLIDWYKNDEPVSMNSKYVHSVQDGLLIKNVTEADDGVYKCSAVVYSTGQFRAKNIKVEVQVPPKIEPMAPITIVEGETASAFCKATGKPPPSYTWIKVDTREDLSTTNRFKVNKNTGELIINGVELRDDGFIQCIAENPVGRVEETVKVNVLVKPRIYELLNQTIPVSNATELLCKVHGRPPPKVTFRKLSRQQPFVGGPQPDDPRINLLQQPFMDKGEAWGKLHIQNVSRSDDGLYECIAENSAGSAYKNGHITVWFKPTFNLTRDLPPAWSWNGKPGNLSCLPEAIPNATITWRWGGTIINEENMNANLIPRNSFQVIGRSRQSFLIVNHNSERRLFGQYECIATNEYGEASIKLELREAHVPGMINQVKDISRTATTITFSIVPPTEYHGLPIRSYTVRVKPQRMRSWDYAWNHTWSAGAPYILENLVAEETYDFQFAARNDVGMGGWLNIPAITMPRRSQPAQPKILVPSHQSENDSNRQDIITVSPYADHFELRWNVPADNGERILEYTISYCVNEKINGQWQDKECKGPIVQSDQYTSYQLENLYPDTVYKIELRAHNAIGPSTPAQIRVRTARGVDPIVPVPSTAMSSTAIIGIVVVTVLVVLLFVDVTCFCVNRTGIIALCCERSKSKKKDEEDPKLGRDERQPLKSEEKTISVEFDGKHVYAKSGEIIGKHSAV